MANHCSLGGLIVLPALKAAFVVNAIDGIAAWRARQVNTMCILELRQMHIDHVALVALAK